MTSNFYELIPIFDEFAEAVRPENYRALPDDWVVGFSDVVGSTQAVAQGRYKAVNMVGAGVIAAVANALERRPFPFVFGGDGASFAISGPDAPAATAALAAMADFAHHEFRLELRVATIPVREIWAAGRDVKVARYGATPHCVYAMFAGGARLVRGRSQARPLCAPARRAGREARSFRSLVPLGSCAGEAGRHPVIDRRAARRRSALRGAR